MERKDFDLAKDITNELWPMIPDNVKKAQKVTWVVLYNVVRKAIDIVGCVDMDRLRDFVDLSVVDMNGIDTIYETLVNELNKAKCDGNDFGFEYDNEAARHMVLSYIRNALNECRKNACSDDDINEISAMIRENREILGSEYGKLINELTELRGNKRPVENKDVSETLRPVKPETKAEVKPEVKVYEEKYVDAGGVMLRAYDEHTKKIREWAKEKARVDLMVQYEIEKAKRESENIDWKEWVKQFKNPNAEDWFVILQPVRVEKTENRPAKPTKSRTKPRPKPVRPVEPTPGQTNAKETKVIDVTEILRPIRKIETRASVGDVDWEKVLRPVRNKGVKDVVRVVLRKLVRVVLRW